MNFQQLNSKLPSSISYKGKDAGIINRLRIDFKGSNEMEYGFYLRNLSSGINSVRLKFDENVKDIISKYTQLSPKDKVKAYIYIYYDASDNPLLCLGMR